MAVNLDSISNITEPINTSKQADVKHPIEVSNETSSEDKMKQLQYKTANEKLEELRNRKRKKTRRAKRRKLKPYSSKLSWQQKKLLQQKQSSKRTLQRLRAEMYSHGQPVAPNNTTQFLMEDHNDLQQLDVHLKPPGTNPECSNTNYRPARARDSSFSVDSDDDYFYSSPEDEEEFLTKEFSNTYEDLHAERLSNMPKSQLVQEYLQLEQKVDILETKLKNSSEADNSKSDFNVDVDSHENIHIFKQKLNKLTLENERLHREIEQLRRLSYKSQAAESDSSIDSESDSTDSTCGTSSDSDEEFSKKPLPSKNDDINKCK